MMASVSELNHIGYFITLISRKNDLLLDQNGYERLIRRGRLREIRRHLPAAFLRTKMASADFLPQRKSEFQRSGHRSAGSLLLRID